MIRFWNSQLEHYFMKTIRKPINFQWEFHLSVMLLVTLVVGGIFLGFVSFESFRKLWITDTDKDNSHAQYMEKDWCLMVWNIYLQFYCIVQSRKLGQESDTRVTLFEYWKDVHNSATTMYLKEESINYQVILYIFKECKFHYSPDPMHQHK